MLAASSTLRGRCGVCMRPVMRTDAGAYLACDKESDLTLHGEGFVVLLQRGFELFHPFVIGTLV